MSHIAHTLMDVCETSIRATLGGNYYDSEKNTIYLNFMLGTDVDKFLKKLMHRPTSYDMSFFHELGHAVFDNFSIDSNEEAQELFGDFEEEYRGTHGLLASVVYKPRGEYLTLYAQEHPEEDFADCFAFVMKHGNKVPKTVKNKRLRKKLTFVKELVDELLEDYT